LLVVSGLITNALGKDSGLDVTTEDQYCVFDTWLFYQLFTHPSIEILLFVTVYQEEKALWMPTALGFTHSCGGGI
jgi:hypothetical protein